MLYNNSDFKEMGGSGMNCIKCGAEVREPQVFCDRCLADMERYPVKPNITVNLPNRPVDPPAKRKSRRTRYIKPEDQIRHLRGRIRLLALALSVALVAFAFTAVMLLRVLDTKEDSYGPGQNYDTISTDNT